MLTLLLTLSAARAEEVPVVLRFDSGGVTVAEPLMAMIVGAGAPSEVQLKDDGVRPDFAKGDGRFAGVARTEGSSFQLELVAAGTSLGKGSAYFSDPTSPHDLDVTAIDGVLNLNVSAPPSAGAAAPQTANGSAPVTNGAPSGWQPDTDDDGTLFVAFGVGLLALLGAFWMWTRGRPVGLPAGLQVLPEPAFLAPGLPSLSDGLTAWVVGDQLEAVLPALLRRLAERHRVILVARAGVEVGAVEGGPVYRMVGLRPSQVGAAAEGAAGLPGQPLCVLLVLDNPDRAALRDFRDLLPPQVGGIVLLRDEVDSPLPRVLLRPSEAGWALEFGEQRVELSAGPRGLEPVVASA